MGKFINMLCQLMDKNMRILEIRSKAEMTTKSGRIFLLREELMEYLTMW